MEDQAAYTPPPIAGYRILTETEIASVNLLKGLERQVLLALADLPDGFDPRARAQARTTIETGFMWAARAVLKPQTVEFEARRPVTDKDIPY